MQTLRCLHACQSSSYGLRVTTKAWAGDAVTSLREPLFKPKAEATCADSVKYGFVCLYLVEIWKRFYKDLPVYDRRGHRRQMYGVFGSTEAEH
jgi:hypothetical protein